MKDVVKDWRRLVIVGFIISFPYLVVGGVFLFALTQFITINDAGYGEMYFIINY